MCLYVGLKHTPAELGLERGNYFIYPSADYERDPRGLHGQSRWTICLLCTCHFRRHGSVVRGALSRPLDDRHHGAPHLTSCSLRGAEQQWQHRGDAYEALKQRYAERLLEVLYRFVPRAEGKVDHCELSTPISTRHFTGNEHGEIYGMAATPARLTDRQLRAQTPIPGLYLAGQDVGVLGVTGAMFGGLIAASAILGRDLGRTVRRG